MPFWWDYKINDFLFKGFNTTSPGGLFGLCLLAGVVSFSFEFFRYLQAKQRQRELYLRSEQLKTICPTESSTLLAENDGRSPEERVIVKQSEKWFLYGSDFSLWFLLQNLGYFLMLTAMNYNGWLFISILFGGGAGYFIFGQLLMKINLKNCQIIRETWCMQKCGEPGSYPNNDGESTPALESIEEPSTSRGHCHQVTVHADCHSEE